MGNGIIVGTEVSTGASLHHGALHDGEDESGKGAAIQIDRKPTRQEMLAVRLLLFWISSGWKQA